MKSKLIVKNFGAIKSASLDLRSVNVIIGPQASGKSTLAKLYTICNSPELYHNPVEKKFSYLSTIQNIHDLNVFKEVSIAKFKEALDDYSILNCLKSNSEIEFISQTHSLKIKNNKIFFEDKIDLKSIFDSFEKKDFDGVKKEFKKLAEISDRFNFIYKFTIGWERYLRHDNSDIEKFDEYIQKNFNYNLDLTEREIKKIIDSARVFKEQIFHNNPLYIPSERTLVNIIKHAFISFKKFDIPIPNHLINFTSIYTNATFKVKNLDISFLKPSTFYKNVNGEDRIYFSSRKSIKLTESASGFQSILPILLPIIYEKNKESYPKLNYSFVIEEPETNLFPKAQYDLLKILEKDRSDDFGKIDKGIVHIYTTHSPFILSSLNNLLFAFSKGTEKDSINEIDIDSIISKKSWINPNDFSAFQIIDGKTKSVFNRKTGLIENNIIDSVSEDIINDFRKIAYIAASK